MHDPFIVGISGGSGSGKTYFTRLLMQSFSPGQVSVLFQDNYYKQRSLVPRDKNGIENFDVPEALDITGFMADIKKLKSGERVERKEYTYNNPQKIPATITVAPAPVILVEGIFLFSFPEILNLLSLKIFIEANEAVKIDRRVKRDAQERGYDLDDVLYRYENHVSPAYKQYLEPFIFKSDLVVPNDNHLKQAVEVIAAFLKSQVIR